MEGERHNMIHVLFKRVILIIVMPIYFGVIIAAFIGTVLGIPALIMFFYTFWVAHNGGDPTQIRLFGYNPFVFIVISIVSATILEKLGRKNKLTTFFTSGSDDDRRELMNRLHREEHERNHQRHMEDHDRFVEDHNRHMDDHHKNHFF